MGDDFTPVTKGKQHLSTSSCKKSYVQAITLPMMNNFDVLKETSVEMADPHLTGDGGGTPTSC